MGLVRFLLACSVIAVHSGPVFGSYFVGGIIAIETFFIISGFYMSLILTEKYKKGAKTYMLFITNRLLRLYPAYIIVALFTLFISLYWASIGLDNRLVAYFQYFGLMDVFAKLYIILINTFIFGQDTIMFLGLNIHTGSLFFTDHYAETVPQLWVMLLVPQAWTLGLELTFYLMAPFLLQLRTYWIIGLILASFSLRIGLNIAGFDPNPWSLRFFPTELFFFLLGVIAHRIYRILETKQFNKARLTILYVFFILLSLCYLFIPTIMIGWFDVRQWVYYLIFFAFMPFIFILTKDSKLDRNLGKLSYPMYIAHSIIIFTMMVYNIGHFHNNYFFGMIAILITLVVSILLVVLIEDPINKYRQKRVLVSRKG